MYSFSEYRPFFTLVSNFHVRKYYFDKIRPRWSQLAGVGREPNTVPHGLVCIRIIFGTNDPADILIE